MLEKMLKYKTNLIQRVTKCKKKYSPKNDKLQNHAVEGTEEERRNFKECWRNDVGTGKQVTYISYAG
jgi:hypothetical protein